MSQAVINELWTVKDNPNKNPNAAAIIPVKHIGYTVTGGFFAERTFMAKGHMNSALWRAETERDARNDFNRNHPWTPPQTKREIAKATKLKLRS